MPKAVYKENMPKEEQEEYALYTRWTKSKEREKIKKYEEVDVKEIPPMYREKLAKLRSFRSWSYNL